MTGTHGKSTTTALLGHLLDRGRPGSDGRGRRLHRCLGRIGPAGGGAPFLVEADEFGDNFLNYHPAGAIVTNVEMDHPDYFADRGGGDDSFERFVRGMGGSDALGGRLLLLTAAGDPGAQELAARLAGWDGRVVRYGPGGEVEATEVALAAATDRLHACSDTRFEMTPGRRAQRPQRDGGPDVARELGADLDALAEGLRTFAGAGRRMELIADTPRVTIYDDYGHHPTEVRAALAAARQKVGAERRLWAVFEPHMYSRTALLLDEFATAFTDADEVVIADIFASRDTAAAMASTSAPRRWPMRSSARRACRPSPPATSTRPPSTSPSTSRDGDAVLVMGAGKSYRIARGLADAPGGEART